MRISDWSSDVCSSDLLASWPPGSLPLQSSLTVPTGFGAASVFPHIFSKIVPGQPRLRAGSGPLGAGSLSGEPRTVKNPYEILAKIAHTQHNLLFLCIFLPWHAPCF